MLKSIHRFNKKGFTLIELLIVVAIIAILAAIAIPQFSSYRKRGYNAAANSDLRNLRTSQEALYADFTDYGASDVAAHTGASFVAGVQANATIFLCGGRTTTTSQSSSLSPNVYGIAKVSFNGINNDSYTLVTGHTAGDQFYGSDSDTTTLYRTGYTATFKVGTYDPNKVAPAAAASADNFSAATAPAWTAVQ